MQIGIVEWWGRRLRAHDFAKLALLRNNGVSNDGRYNTREGLLPRVMVTDRPLRRNRPMGNRTTITAGCWGAARTGVRLAVPLGALDDPAR